MSMPSGGVCGRVSAVARAVVGVGALGLFACGGDDGSPSMLVGPGARMVCLPGQVDRCDCGGGVVGVSACNPDGLSSAACECPQGAAPAQPGLQPSGGDGDAVSVPGPAPDQPNQPTPGTGDGDGDGTVTMPEPEPPADPRARDIRIREVAMYQAVKVALAQDGAPVVARNAPVIVGKEAFVRVFVEPQDGFTPRELAAELTLSSAENPGETLRVEQRIDGDSDDADLGSTVNFDVPAGAIADDTTWSVTLMELDPDAATGTIDPAARFPTEMDAMEELGARSAGPLRVMLVPYRYMADGSGRLPAMSDEDLETYKSFIYAYYPVIEVEFEIHEPVDYRATIGPNTGWNEWLDSHCSLRLDENPDPKKLYYGIVAPRESARAYGGGVAGVSYLPGPAANYGRCSVGLGFGGQGTAFIMAHELGHSLGLPHAPCGVSGGPFPYDEALIGSWGFGLSSRTLKEPDEYYDMMSYCDPAFISDYNFQKLFERVRYLNLQFAQVQTSASATSYARVLQYPDGRLEVVGHHVFSQPPGGDEERRLVPVWAADGSAMDAREAYFIPTGEMDSGVWFVPDADAGRALLDAQEIAL